MAGAGMKATSSFVFVTRTFFFRYRSSDLIPKKWRKMTKRTKTTSNLQKMKSCLNILIYQTEPKRANTLGLCTMWCSSVGQNCTSSPPFMYTNVAQPTISIGFLYTHNYYSISDSCLTSLRPQENHSLD